MHLAEYFTNQCQFAQAEYLLYAALKIIPADDSQEELRCMVQTAVGNYYQHLLEFLTKAFIEQESIDSDLVHKKAVEFGALELRWP